jgi:hypothetical protein
VSNLGNGKSYNSVAIFQKLILVVGSILEAIRVIKKPVRILNKGPVWSMTTDLLQLLQLR